MGLEALYTGKKYGSTRKSSIDAVLSSEKFKGVLPEDDIRNLLMDVDTNISLDRVILSDENKTKLKQFISENQHRQELIKYGLRPTNRILCYGASGCGKTFMGKALSNTLGYTMLYIDIAESLSQGKVAINLSNIFKLGNVGGCMIFLDECDSIGWNRDAKNAESGDVRRATNALFQQMDQLNPDSMIIAATNMLNRLDPAFERRFDIKMEFRRPSLDLVSSIMHFKKPEFGVINDVDDDTMEMVKNRIKSYTKLSYYEIEGMTERAMKKAIITHTTVRTSDNKDIYAIRLSWIIDEIKTTLKIKKRFHTDTDEAEADNYEGNQTEDIHDSRN